MADFADKYNRICLSKMIQCHCIKLRKYNNVIEFLFIYTCVFLYMRL